MVERLIRARRRLLEVVEHACRRDSLVLCGCKLRHWCRRALAACRERCCSFRHLQTELSVDFSAAVRSCGAVSDTQSSSVEEASLVCLQPLASVLGH